MLNRNIVGELLPTEAHPLRQDSPPRVAFLADAFHEVNGVARTCRLFEQFARQRNLPFLSIHCGEDETTLDDGAISIFQLRRSPLAFFIDTDLKFDLLLQRDFKRIKQRVQAFAPDVVHITGPGDLGIIGARVAHTLRVPLVIAWHANIHEYAATRLRSTASFLPKRWNERMGTAIERFVLSRLAWFIGSAS